MRKAKLSKLERMVHSLFEIGKYPAYAIAIAGSLGCVELPLPINFSKDGRYVVMPVDDDGMILGDKGDSRIAVIDTQKNNFYFMNGRFKQPLWVTTTGEKVALIGEGEDHSTNVYIATRKSTDIIKNASYPVLSPDGNYLCYAKVIEQDNVGQRQVLPRTPIEMPVPVVPQQIPEEAAPMPKAPKADPSASNLQGANSIRFASYQQQKNNIDYILYMRDLRTGLETKIDDNGIISDFSPNGKMIAYIRLNGNKEYPTPQLQNPPEEIFQPAPVPMQEVPIAPPAPAPKSTISRTPNAKLVSYQQKAESQEPDAYLYVCGIDGKNKIMVSSINLSNDEASESLPLYPRWINNNQLIYQTRNQKTGDDTEIFIYDTRGNVEQVTNNDLEELLPQMGPDGKIYFVAEKRLNPAAEPQFAKYDINFWSSQKRGNNWVSQRLGIKPLFYAIAGNNVYFMEDESEDNRELRKGTQTPKPTSSRVYMIPLQDAVRGDRSKMTDLSSVLKAR